MAEPPNSDYKSDAKYKQFSAAVERALKRFEDSTEWPDLISSLARLNKVLLAYRQYPVVPLHLTVSKRLSQCLHPNLPGGVHLKALDVYKAIFERIDPKGLTSDLLLYSCGLFPLLGNASMSVRPVLLDLYEQYYLPLAQELLPCLHGFVLGLLPGIEEGSEHNDRISQLLDAVCSATDNAAYFTALWQCVLGSPTVRLPATTLLLARLNKRTTAEDQPHCLGGSIPLLIAALCAALLDKNVLVARGALDIVSVLFPLHRPFLPPSDVTTLTRAALQTLLRRDVSLNRRLTSWLLGCDSSSLQLQTTEEEGTLRRYFDTYSRVHVTAALKVVISQAVTAATNVSKPESVLPYRLLNLIVIRAEFSDGIARSVMDELMCCLKAQVESLGGLSSATALAKDASGGRLKAVATKKTGKKTALKSEILQSMSLFLKSLSTQFIWEWMDGLMSEACNHIASSRGGQPGSHSPVEEDEVAASREWIEEEANVNISLSRSASAVLALLEFVLQVLPLDSMENAREQHIPSLLLSLLGEMDKCQAVLTLSELQACFSLLSLITEELLHPPSFSSSRSSLASTPVSPTAPPSYPTPESAQESRGSSPSLQPQTPDSGSLSLADSMQLSMATKQRAVQDYLTLFSKLVTHRLLSASVVLAGDSPSSSKALQALCCSACSVLLLMAKLTSAPALGGSPQPWLTSLMALCKETSSRHMTFVALPTLLRLLEMPQCLMLQRNQFQEDVGNVVSSLTTPGSVQYITSQHSFLLPLTELLWSCLSATEAGLHQEAARLLVWLHSLVTPSAVCEETILRHFATQGIRAYEYFAVLWQYSPPSVSATPSKPFSRATLRMLEGLHSQDVAISHLAQSWVEFVIQQGGVSRLLEPLLCILLSAQRSPPAPQPRLKEELAANPEYAKYYYSSLGLPHPDEISRDQYEAIALSYSTIMDSDQAVYALSLLSSLLAVHPTTAVVAMAGAVINATSYAASKPAEFGTQPMSETSSSMCLLQVVISACVDYLRSDYPSSLEASVSEYTDSLKVKVAACHVLSLVLCEFVTILAQLQAQDGGTASDDSCFGAVGNASFVSALVTLCDLQKVVLLLLGQVVQQLKAAAGDSLASSSPQKPLTILQSLFVHVLCVVQNLITVDAQCSVGVATPKATTPLTQPAPISTSLGLPPVLADVATAAQPFFHGLFLLLLEEPILLPLHGPLLSMLAGCLPSLWSVLDDLAPKLIKQLCQNLERTQLQSEPLDTAMQSISSGKMVVCYLEALVVVTLWCLFGRRDGPHVKPLHHRQLNQFWKTLDVKEAKEINESLSPTSKQPSPMTWLLGVFSASATTGPAPSATPTEFGKSLPPSSRGGVASRVGQNVLMLLPAVYNAVTEVWRRFNVAAPARPKGAVIDKTRSMEFQDVQVLLVQLLWWLAVREPAAFLSSVSHVWLEWNLEAKVQKSKKLSRRMDAFIELLHQSSVLTLEQLVGHVKTALTDIVKANFESGLLRQKYLLHFLYKYLSSTLQSAEELSGCAVVLVAFLRECYTQYFTQYSPRTLYNNCHLFCMLASILHVLVCRVSTPEPKKQKKERKDLQDLTHKLCEALGMASNVGIAGANYVVVDGSSGLQGEAGVTTDSTDKEARVDSPPPPPPPAAAAAAAAGSISSNHSVDTAASATLLAVAKQQSSSPTDVQLTLSQALAVLSNVLSHFIDFVFDGTEKDKVHYLLKCVLCNIWPHLYDHSVDARVCYRHAVKLLSSLSGYQVTRKAWKKEVFELFLATDFFITEFDSLLEWKVIVDNLMTQDQVTFKDLLSRIHSSPASGVANIFSSVDQEVVLCARLLKRMAFVILSAELDQFVQYLPDIQEKLSDSLKSLHYPLVCAEVFSVFRVLLIRFSSHHLMAFWPSITSELLAVLSQLEAALPGGLEDSTPPSRESLALYLAACKLLDTALALPSELLPHFQMLQWGFTFHIPHSVTTGRSLMTKLCRHYLQVDGSEGGGAPYLREPRIASLSKLKPLFHALLPGNNMVEVLRPAERVGLVEQSVLRDFIEVA